ncbi:HlyD family secretion protein [Eisenibacter elegans]|uniref:HlyD family secretion protein n=1 Tax=Eisenibacter elegans TaxID=997 RepID=UPI0004113AC2|nr:biotin/lipoyl-binding protein [Eisenibacter elegans]
MLRISKDEIEREEVQRIENSVYSLRTLYNPKTARRLTYWLSGLFGLMFLALFLPWQQNVVAVGEVTALNPQDRPQDVQTAIAGRIREWRVMEGQFVKKGDTIIVLDEIKADYFDPELLVRLQEQVDAKEDGITATRQKIMALNNQIAALNQGLQLSLEKARNKYKQARFKVISDSTDLGAERINYQIAQVQFARFDTLYAQGVVSRTAWEQRQLKLQETNAKVIAVENKLLTSRNELINAAIELNSLEAEYRDKISKAESDRSSAIGYLADAQGELSKLRNYYANMVIRNDQYYLIAPQAGYVVKALKSGIGEAVKENDAIITIMPAQPNVAVQVYARAMDVPLLAVGRHVRLEFDGWPALQFSGWPGLSVGTFGGRIAVIDYVDSKEGMYRLLVIPDPDDDPWPEQIRVGSGVYSWVMLKDVPVWYEIWRQLNGFPPDLYEEDDDKDGPKAKSANKIKLKVK